MRSISRNVLDLRSGYKAAVPGVSIAKVSPRGQVNLSSELRHRWGIEVGDEVGIIDLGDSVLVIPVRSWHRADRRP